MFWAAAVTKSGEEYSLAKKWSFPNITSLTYKIPAPEGASSKSTEYVDIQRADGMVIRFPKKTGNINGIDGTLMADGVEITTDSKGHTLTGVGEVTVVIAQAPEEVISWTKFISDVVELMRNDPDGRLLIAFPTGESHIKRSVSADGYGYMMGKISSDIEQQLTNNATSLSVTFKSVSTPELTETDFTSFAFDPIEYNSWSGGGKSYAVPAITTQTAGRLIAGQLELVATI